MTPLGHSLVGLSFAVIAFPAAISSRKRFAFCVAPIFVALANLPDWPIPGWGHDRYNISHSIFVNAALISIVVAIISTLQAIVSRFEHAISLRLMAIGAAAWLSHLFLDSLYSHGQGITIGWPFNEFRLRFPVAFFHIHWTSPNRFSANTISLYSGLSFWLGPPF